MPLVSIIIPVYNVALYIEESLKSALTQTYENIEYIIVDDCGNDISMDIVRRMKMEYPDKNIRIIYHSNNQGLSAARNTGIEVATGEYLFFMDSDDKITSDCIALHIATLEKYNTDLSVGGINVIGGSNRVSDVLHATYINGPENVVSCFFNGIIHVSACNKLIKRSFLNDHNIRFVNGLMFEDFEWTFRIVQLLQSVALIPDKTYQYFIRDNSITTSAISTKHIHSREYLQNILVEYIEDCKNERMINCAKCYLAGQQFKYSAIIICSSSDFCTKKTYYKRLNSSKYRKYGKGIYSLFTALPFELFYSIFYLPRKAYSFLTSSRNSA